MRGLAKGCAEGYVKERAALGFPLLPPADGQRAKAAFEAAMAEEAGVSAAAVRSSRLGKEGA